MNGPAYRHQLPPFTTREVLRLIPAAVVILLGLWAAVVLLAAVVPGVEG